MKKLLVVFMLIFGGTLLSAQVSVFSLNGIWQLQDSPHSDFSLPAEVPGTVFESLLAEKQIEDPFYGTNEQKAAPLLKKDWRYSRSFTLSPAMVAADSLLLCFEGIDTFGDIEIDGKTVLSTDNMHRFWSVDLKALSLTAGEHQLGVTLKSASEYALRQYKRYGVSLMQGNACGVPGTPFTRKAWYSYGWDWGAQLPDAGIWKDCYLKAVNHAEICHAQVLSDIHFAPFRHFDEIHAERADLRIHLTTQAFREGELTAEATLSGYGQSVRTSIQFDAAVGEGQSDLLLSIDHPKLWWIHELGTPALYELTLILRQGDRVLDTLTQSVGIRSLKLVRDPDAQGETFYFRLNQVPVFAKGANWIPCDTFIPRGIKAGIVEKRLADAKAANFNFIRVWGGGIYETDAFYETCDRLGLLVWQDFAFACYATPACQDYYDNVQQEINENIIRLRNHPSLALWVGNNEIEEAWKYWGYLLLFDSHKSSYHVLFNEKIPATLARLDPTRSYWPSSPHSADGVYASNDPNSGDSHFWSVWHGGLPFSAYRNFPSRFMSEYGFESFPDIKTIRRFASPNDFSFSSKVMENHQKNGAGNGLIKSYMRKQYSVPKTFEKQVIVSQLTQAEAMAYGIDSWRARRHNFGSMGSLYWQFNDSWPVASWSSVDYYGRWKALHYFAKRSYAPIACSVLESKKSAQLWLINDTRSETPVILSYSLQNVDGTVYTEKRIATTLPACDSFLGTTVDITPFRKGLSTRHLILFWDLSLPDDQPLSRGFKLFDKPKYRKAAKPTVQTQIRPLPNGEFEVTLTSDQNTLYTHFNTPYDFTASDCFFHLIKGIPYTVTVRPWEPISVEAFTDGLRVESYYELMH